MTRAILSKSESHFSHITVSCARAERSAKQGGVKSIPKSPRNVAPFTTGGWPVDALSPGTMRLLKKIADQDGWTIEEVMTITIGEVVAERRAEKELGTKIICFPKC